jgi:hypothetical protein
MKFFNALFVNVSVWPWIVTDTSSLTGHLGPDDPFVQSRRRRTYVQHRELGYLQPLDRAPKPLLGDVSETFLPNLLHESH